MELDLIKLQNYVVKPRRNHQLNAETFEIDPDHSPFRGIEAVNSSQNIEDRSVEMNERPTVYVF